MMFLTNFENPLDWIALDEIDRDGAQFLGLLQPFCHLVDHIDFRSTLQKSAIRQASNN